MNAKDTDICRERVLFLQQNLIMYSTHISWLSRVFIKSPNQWKMLVHVWKNLLCLAFYPCHRHLNPDITALNDAVYEGFNCKNWCPCLDLFTKSRFDWPAKGMSIELVLVYSFKAAICRNFVWKMCGKTKTMRWNNNRHYVKDLSVFCFRDVL